MLNIEPLENEKLYKELEDLGTRLRIPVPQCHLGIKVLDRTGKVIRDTSQRAHSWNRNAYNIIGSQLLNLDATGAFGPGTSVPIKDVNGNTLNNATGTAVAETTVTQSGYSSDPLSQGQGFMGAVGIATHGIVVGIGATAESFEDYQMSSPCAEGTGANQLHYVLTENPVNSWDAGTRRFTVTWKRYLNNNTSGIITITNIGIISCIAQGSGDSYRGLICRDVLAPAVEVPGSGQLLVTYAIALVFPS